MLNDRKWPIYTVENDYVKPKMAATVKLKILKWQ